MRQNKKIKIFGLLTIVLFWIGFFSVIRSSLPFYIPLISIVLLIISSFFTMLEGERILRQQSENKDLPPLDFTDSQNKKLEEEAHKIRKGSFVLQKHILTQLEKQLKTENQIKEELSVLQESLIKAIKTSIKYDRDNTNNMIEALKQDSVTESVSQAEPKTDERVLEYLSAISEGMKANREVLSLLSSKIEDLANRPVLVEGTKATAVSEPEPIAQPEPISEPEPIAQPEPIPEPEPAPEPEPTPEPEQASEPEPTPEPEQTPSSVIDSNPNKMMTPEEIAALIAASEPEPIPEPEQSPEPEPIPEPEPAPIPAPADPNKPMSPEEIAALISSLGG